jgi:response regulator RpfG family c-di-GMP phosphodiesterase
MESQEHGNISKRILIVDDSAVIRHVLSKQLETLGMGVTQAQDGRQGLDIALTEPFDLIISDVEMPNMDGYQFCREIKKHPQTRGTPVIILSSLDADKDIDNGFQVGASAYVSKATAQKDLEGTIARVLEAHSFHRDRLILVVDDSLTIRKMVQKGLEETGFQVVAAENGQAALNILEACRPDLILSDIDMPVMNGVDLCKSIQTLGDLAAIPFIIMSANNDRSMMRRSLEWGAAAYLVKPFNLEQLVITVEKLLSDNFLLMLKDRQRLEAEQKSLLAGITSLITALEARDQYTRGHSEEVARLVDRMAAQMNIDPGERESLFLAGRLHDIGKIGVPDGILLKPGRLTDEEFDIIKQHPDTGVRILGSITSMKSLLPVIHYHHERLDGKGYPEGLKGSAIPLWARMTAVADTYHALTSDRPYRKGMPQDKALAIIEEVRGTQLCPDCVDVFFRIIDVALTHEDQWVEDEHRIMAV